MRRLISQVIILGLFLLLSGFPTDSQAEQYYTSLTRLTTDPSVDYFPSWSPDGKQIVFHSDREGGHLWVVPSTGGTPTRLTDTEANHPRWSPNGDYIAHDCERGTAVSLIPAGGGTPVRIVSDSIKISRGAFACWTNDGSAVTFSAEGDIWTIDLPTGQPKRIFHREGANARAFSWSPDGRYITADVGGADKSDDNVWLIPVDGSEPIVLTNLPGREGNPVFSPDGSMIAFMNDQNGKKEIRIMTSDGGKSIVITNHDGFNANPRWSPDGTRMAFASDMEGSPDIWVMDLDLVRIRAALGIDG